MHVQNVMNSLWDIRIFLGSSTERITLYFTGVAELMGLVSDIYLLHARWGFLYHLEQGSECFVLAFPLHQKKRSEARERNLMDPLLSDLRGSAIADQVILPLCHGSPTHGQICHRCIYYTSYRKRWQFGIPLVSLLTCGSLTSPE